MWVKPRKLKGSAQESDGTPVLLGFRERRFLPSRTAVAGSDSLGANADRGFRRILTVWEEARLAEGASAGQRSAASPAVIGVFFGGRLCRVRPRTRQRTRRTRPRR